MEVKAEWLVLTGEEHLLDSLTGERPTRDFQPNQALALEGRLSSNSEFLIYMEGVIKERL